MSPTENGQWREVILAKLRVEEAVNLSDAELSRCLSGCVAGKKCVAIAKGLRAAGEITVADLSRR